VSDEKLRNESPTSRHLQVLYHQTSFQDKFSHNASIFLFYGGQYVCIFQVFAAHSTIPNGASSFISLLGMLGQSVKSLCPSFIIANGKKFAFKV